MTRQRSEERSAPVPALEELVVEEAAPPHPTVEEHCAAKKTPAWLFAAAKALRRWPIGRVLSEADYDAAIREAGSVQLSSPTIRTR